jgi:iron complex outermembrane receptor protein
MQMGEFRRFLIGSSILMGASAIVAATPSLALAQTSAGGAAAADAKTQKKSDEVSELIVTGSRIKNSYTSDSALQVIDTDLAEQQGRVSPADILNSSSLNNFTRQFQNVGTQGAGLAGGAGANQISLRGIGAQRTLVLLNGRRLGPGGTRAQVSAVDLNVLPAGQISRYEVLTDGASSIYGSDAVAGVVNIITKSNYNGGSVNAYVGVPENSGGRDYRFSANQGWTFDRGYGSIALDYYKRESLKFRDRPFFACAVDYVSDRATGARIDVLDPATGKPKCFNTGTGTITNFVTGQTLVPDASQPGGFRAVNLPSTDPATRRANIAALPTTDPRYLDNDALLPLERYGVFASGGYDVAPGVEAYGEFLWNRRKTSIDNYRTVSPSLNAANPNNALHVTAAPNILVPNFTNQRVDYTRGVIGLRGKIPESAPLVSGWDWDVDAQYSRSDGHYRSDFIRADRIAATTGALACNPAVLTVSGSTCQPVDYFGAIAGGFSAADAAYLIGNESGNTVYTQAYVEGSMTGVLLHVPAGDVSAAVGFHVRRETMNDRPGVNEQSLNFFSPASGAFAGVTKGSDNVKELFGELQVPLVKDLPLMKRVTFIASGRYSDYKSYGNNTTYKVGLDWQVFDWLRLRGNKGNSFRAPGLFELYLAPTISTITQAAIDSCINWGLSTNPTVQKNCGAAGIPSTYGGSPVLAQIQSGGGKGVLRAETSDQYTIGAVFTPKFADLHISVDYYELEINDSIIRLTPNLIISNCYTAADYPTNEYCGLFTRSSTAGASQFAITNVNNAFLNVSKQYTRGIDLNFAYRRETPWFTGQLTGAATWILGNKQKTFPTSVPVDTNGRAGFGDFAGNLQFLATRGTWSFNWSTDFLGKASDDEFTVKVQGNNPQLNGYRQIAGINGTNSKFKWNTEFTALHHVSVRKQIDKNASVLVGVRNVFDEAPPNISFNDSANPRIGTTILNPQFDWLGRTFYFNVTKSW